MMKNTHKRVTRIEIGALLSIAATLFTLLLASLILGAPVVQARPVSPDETSSSPARQQPTPTPSPTPHPVFTATVEVLPSAARVEVGEAITVEISIRTSEGCSYALYESTLSQEARALFDYVHPPTSTVGPPGSTRYLLSARSAGTVTFTATLYGERYCGDFWNWRYLYGASDPLVVTDENLSERFYIPIVEQTP